MNKYIFIRQLCLTIVVAAVTACAGIGPDSREDERRAEYDAAGQQDNADGRPYAARPIAAPTKPVPHQAAEAQKTETLNDPAGALTGVPGFSQRAVPACCARAPVEPVDRENYDHLDDNPVRLASEHPVSTFSIDVDTGSYSNVRRFLNHGQLPPADAVRVEELVNYFSYDYPAPRTQHRPFNVITELARTPWNADTLLLHVGLKGFEVPRERRPAANLVFLVDVSGSMQSQNKLPLLKDALSMLTRHLDERDTISIAGYAGGAGLILEPTSGGDKQRVLDALNNLSAAGRTNGAQGIHLAYQMAEASFVEGGINRVIIATDGDFNVGTVSFEALVGLIEEKRRNGVALTALGFGTGNYNDKLLEQLADAGNGNYAYIDNRREARKVLVEEMASTLQTIAKDVKVQIEFNPAVVAEYRLIGYENRMLRREDFNNDAIDAGEIGAGHTVTALYEITLHGSPAQLNDPLRYAGEASEQRGHGGELAFLRLRYKAPDGDTSELIERAITPDMQTKMDRDFRFAAAVAAFGQRLRGGDYLGGYGFESIAELADRGRGRDRHGYRAEFVDLVEQATTLTERMARQDVAGQAYRVAN